MENRLVKSTREGETLHVFSNTVNTHTHKKCHINFEYSIYKFYYDNLNLRSSPGLSAVRYLCNLIYRLIMLRQNTQNKPN